MSEGVTTTRLSKAAREFNIGIKTVVDFLVKKGFPIEMDPNTKLSSEMYSLLMKEFASEKHVKEEAKKICLQFTAHETITIEDKKSATKDREKELDDLFIKNVSMDFEKKQYESAKKAREVVVREPVREEKRVEIPPPPPPVVEIPAEPPVSVEEIVNVPVVTEEKLPEIVPVIETIEPTQTEITQPAEITLPAEEIVTTISEVQTEAPPQAEPETEAEQKPRNDLKIIGMMDLGVFEKKPTKKIKDKPQPTPADVLPDLIEMPEVVLETILPEVSEAPVPVPEQIAEIPVIPAVAEPVQESNFLPTERIKLEGPTILGSMQLPEPKKFEKKKAQPVASSSDETLKSKKKKRKRIKRQGEDVTPAAATTEIPRPSLHKPTLAKDKKFHKDVQKTEVRSKILRNKSRKPLHG